MANPDLPLGRDPARALTIIKENLQTDKGLQVLFRWDWRSYDKNPQPGTFKEYRHWKADTSGISAGQINAYRSWHS